MNEKPGQQLAASRYRGSAIIWGSQFMALGLFFALTRFVGGGDRPERNETLLAALGAAGLGSVALSFLLRSKLVRQGVERRRPDVVTSAYVLAFALCEACALFGVLAHFVTGAPEAVLFFAVAALGLMLHFPRRAHFESAAGGGGDSFTSTM